MANSLSFIFPKLLPHCINRKFPNTPLWVRDYEGKPELKDKRKWLFWQHSNQGKIEGMTKPVDLNVYEGSIKEWHHFYSSKAS